MRFNDDSTFDIKLCDMHNDKNTNEIFDKYGFFKNYGATINDSLSQVVLTHISLNNSQIDSIKSYLRRANGNSIGYKYEFWDVKNGGGLIEIGYPTNDFYGLTYILMDSSKDAEFLNNVAKKCNYKVINKKTLLKYGGPAFGSDCFPDE
jgi:hypothetical protein